MYTLDVIDKIPQFIYFNSIIINPILLEEYLCIADIANRYC